MRFKVVYSVWGADEEEFDAGENEVLRPTKKFLRLLASAEAVGVVEDVEASAEERATMQKAIQTQEAGEAANAKAVASGDWHEGNVRARLEQDISAAADEQVSPEDKALLDYRIAEHTRLLELIAETPNYETAVAKLKDEQAAAARSES